MELTTTMSSPNDSHLELDPELDLYSGIFGDNWTKTFFTFVSFVTVPAAIAGLYSSQWSSSIKGPM
jgi:hypothetical protein